MTSQTRIAATFASLKDAGHMAFMPFVTAGDPDISSTKQVIQELGRRGVDLIEVGFPYSDPIADGPVIQASYTRALNDGFQVGQIFEAVSDLDTESLPPLVAMVSFAIIFRIGTTAFIEKAKSAGFAGFIVPDLPADEAADLASLVRDNELDLIQLIAPTTTEQRAQQIIDSSSGFVYCISVAGVTGERTRLPEALTDQLKWLREKTDLPLCVGFGISRGDQVDMLRGLADGVIVGSAIVRKFEEPESVIAEVGELAEEFVSATHQ